MLQFTSISNPVIPSYNFVVHVGKLAIPFSKISSIEFGIHTEPLVEGGENRFVHSLASPPSGEKILVMERGVDLSERSKFNPIVMTDARKALRVGMKHNYITIGVMDQNGKVQKMYGASFVIVKNKKLSELNALTGEVFIESIEFIYKDMTELPNIIRN